MRKKCPVRVVKTEERFCSFIPSPCLKGPSFGFCLPLGTDLRLDGFLCHFFFPHLPIRLKHLNT